MKLKLSEIAKLAVDRFDVRRALRVADILRFEWGMNYEQSYQKVAEWTGVDRDTWEELLYEADSLPA